MRVLFITFNDIYDIKTGGDQCSKRNYLLLKNNGNVDCIRIKKESNIVNIHSILHKYYPPLSAKNIKEILNKVKIMNYGIVYLDSSLMGILAKKIKKIYPKISIVVFFHNVELDYVNVRMKRGIKNSVYKYLAKRQESMSLGYADRTIALNIRDGNRIKDLYNNEIDRIIPITYEDTYKKDNVEINKDKIKIGLFVGALGRANYDGLKWFVENSEVLNQFELQVVGKNFENVRDDFRRWSINIIGTVDNTDTFYENADFVIAPILYGGGMKVKIAEAIMYGKTIVGTKEAFEGYNDDSGEVLIECNDIKSFDKALIRLIGSDNPKFNLKSRKLFKEKYCTETYINDFNELVRSLDKKDHEHG